MKKLLVFRLCVTELLRNKQKTFLTMLGIIVGIAAVIAILALGIGLENRTVHHITGNEDGKVRLVVNFIPHDESLYDQNVDFFTEQDQLLLESVVGTGNVILREIKDDIFYHQVSFKDNIINDQPVILEDKDVQVEYGRSITSYDNDLKNRVVIIPEKLGENIFSDVENALNRTIEIDSSLFKIIGVSNAVDAVVLPLLTYEQLYPTDDNISYMEILVDAESDLETMSNNLVTRLTTDGFRAQEGKYDITDTSQIASGIGVVMKGVTLFIVLVASIALFISGIGVMNMIYTSVEERKKEIGIKRALGATKRNIRNEFLLEGIIITFTGGIIGYILGMIIATIISSVLGFTVYPDFLTIVISISISLVVGILSSIFPAIRASNKNTIDILR